MNPTAPAPKLESEPAKSKWRWIGWLFIVAALIGAAKVFGLFPFLQAQLRTALDWIRGLGFWGPVFFIGLYILACVFFLPGWVLTVGAGAITVIEA